jgi:hypothetical protein
MCTYITTTVPVSGAGKGGSGWFEVARSVIGYDHPTHAEAEHALLLDFTAGPADDGSLPARVAVELDLESGRALLAQLTEVIRAAEQTGV